MAIEIERKFLVHTDRWQPDPSRGSRYRQGYLSIEADLVVRVRTVGARGFLTVKGGTSGITRLEFEYPIPLDDANTMLDRLCPAPLIEKIRYRIPDGAFVWEVDVFEGENAGLVLAEVELPSADAVVTPPPWVGEEVSEDPRYYNAYLARHPFKQWREGD